MKRFISALIGISLIFSSVLSVSFSALAGNYEDELKKQGFPDSYISKLSSLHEKYPEWTFTPLMTGLDFSTAVAGERQKHSNQIIEKTSDYSDIYYCQCENCYKNGTYVFPYSSCVCASDWAVRYFMDPRNWLDEKHIFEFETTAYNSAQTQSGVEAIISPTWMKNSKITYLNTEGATETYKNSSGTEVKYSKAIMEAAKSSGLGAYYIASRIVKEVGATTAKATGVAGNKAPFNGMYNYYSIGASSTAKQGLEWASGFLKASKKTTMYSAYDSNKKAGVGTQTVINSGQTMSYIGTYGDYYKVMLYDSSFNAGAKGYIAASDLRTTYFTYERPWTNPYKSILGGAKFIAANYKNQYTPYLQKFNVNPNSTVLYSHEYMANVNAVSVEAVSAYNAYNKAGELSKAKTFIIPVFNNMPESTAQPSTQESQSTTAAPAKVTGLKVKSTTVSKINLAWKAYPNASKYYIHIKNETRKTTFTKTVTTNSASLKNLTEGNKYTIKVRAYAGGKWSKYSSTVSAKAIPSKAKITSLTASKGGKIKVKWKKVSTVSGYQVYFAKDKKFKKIVAKKNFDSKTLSHTGKNLTKGKKYYVKVRAYKKVGKKKYYGKWSDIKSIKAK